MKWLMLGAYCFTAFLTTPVRVNAVEDEYSVRQITFGPKHHFFGYIGQAGTIPWNASGRYIVALQVDFQDHLPEPGEAAEIVLLDSENNYALRVLDRTCAWNPQQGTMLYWNPLAPETQFFFNDRDLDTNKIFTVLFDISKGPSGERVREYRFSDVAFGNSGVAQKGGFFLGLNYGRLFRLRPVTGYLDAWDWTEGDAAPKDDGIFLVDANSGEKRLLVSYAQLRDEIRDTIPYVGKAPLFINHTLWNRENDLIYFYVRGNFESETEKINVPFTVDLEGHLSRQQFLGGHPEWELGHTMIGSHDDQQVLYDTDSKKVIQILGPPGAFPRPGGDVALSPDGKRFVNGYGVKKRENYYVILSRPDNHVIHTRAFSRGEWTSGALRLDPSPCWNRSGTQILVPAITNDPTNTRQLFLIILQ